MFGSLLPEFLARAESKVLLRIDLRLHGLFRRAFPHVEILDRQQQVPEHRYDSHVPLGSLGLELRNSLQDFDRQPKRFLVAAPERVTKMREWIASKAQGKFVCGVSWLSTNPRSGLGRSLPLMQLIKGIAIPEVVFVNLQYGPVSAEIAECVEQTGVSILQCEGLDIEHDIDGVAALMTVCDGIISVGNSTAHLAGALGQPAAVLLAKIAPWRWMAEGSHCVWYPTLHLLRQSEFKQWSTVIADGATWLRERMAE
jgi:hypothetical protein